MNMAAGRAREAMSSVELVSHPLLVGLDAPTRQMLEADLRRHAYTAGQTIALEGDPCQAVGLVARGLVRERHVSLEGRQYVMAYAGPGALLGLAAAVESGNHRATADALTDVILYGLPVERLRSLLAASPSLSLAVAQHLAAESRRLGEMVKELALHDVRTRLARFLL